MKEMMATFENAQSPNPTTVPITILMSMAHSNPNLAPEVITDRNGKRTTVHRRRSSDATKQRSLPAPAQDHREAASASPDLRAVLFDQPLTRWQETAFNLIFSLSPELETLSERLLSTGTDTGRRAAQETLVSEVNKLAAAYERSDKPTSASRAYGHLTGQIVRAWSYGNVREEAELSPEKITDEDLSALQYVHSVYTSEVTPYDDIPEEDHRNMSVSVVRHWRGLSALALSVDFETLPDEMWDHTVAFVYFAADHEDIGKVIRAASERENINPHDLTKIIEAIDSGVPSNLTDGWI